MDQSIVCRMILGLGDRLPVLIQLSWLVGFESSLLVLEWSNGVVLDAEAFAVAWGDVEPVVSCDEVVFDGDVAGDQAVVIALEVDDGVVVILRVQDIVGNHRVLSCKDVDGSPSNILHDIVVDGDVFGFEPLEEVEEVGVRPSADDDPIRFNTMNEVLLDGDMVGTAFDDDAAPSRQVTDFIMSDVSIPDGCKVDAFFSAADDEISDDGDVLCLRDLNAIQPGIVDDVAFDGDIANDVGEVMAGLCELNPAAMVGAIDFEVSYDEIVCATPDNRASILICRDDLGFTPAISGYEPDGRVIRAAGPDFDVLIVAASAHHDGRARLRPIGRGLDRR